VSSSHHPAICLRAAAVPGENPTSTTGCGQIVRHEFRHGVLECEDRAAIHSVPVPLSMFCLSNIIVRDAFSGSISSRE
jgi:hypothetical protein